MAHKEFDGRKVAIITAPGCIGAPAGTVGDVKYAGWDDWYYVFVDGVYYVRARAAKIEPYILTEVGKGPTL